MAELIKSLLGSANDVARVMNIHHKQQNLSTFRIVEENKKFVNLCTTYLYSNACSSTPVGGIVKDMNSLLESIVKYEICLGNFNFVCDDNNFFASTRVHHLSLGTFIDKSSGGETGLKIRLIHASGHSR